MKMKISKLRVFASFMLSSVAFAAGEMDTSIPQIEGQVSEAHFEATKGDYGASMASMASDDSDQNGRGWFLDGALLYWRARVDGTEFGYVQREAISDIPLDGEVQSIKFGGDWGIKLGVGKYLSWDNWDTSLQYTFFRAHGKRRFSIDDDWTDDDLLLIPTRAAPSIASTALANIGTTDLFGFCTTSNSDYLSRWHSLCLDLGRNSAVSNGFSLHPHLGVRFDILRQRQKIYHTGGTKVADVLGLGDGFVDVRDKTRFHGIGPQIGVHSQLHLGCGFSILGGISSAYLVGYWKVNHHEDWMISASQGVDQADISECRYGAAPTMQLQLGLHYDYAFQGCKQNIDLGFDFESHYFWKQFQSQVFHLDYVLNRSSKQVHDMSMHGLTLRGTWNF